MERRIFHLKTGVVAAAAVGVAVSRYYSRPLTLGHLRSSLWEQAVREVRSRALRALMARRVRMVGILSSAVLCSQWAARPGGEEGRARPVRKREETAGELESKMASSPAVLLEGRENKPPALMRTQFGVSTEVVVGVNVVSPQTTDTEAALLLAAAAVVVALPGQALDLSNPVVRVGWERI